MRIQVLSDLHLSRGDLATPRTDAGLVVLAGDIGRPKEAIAWATRVDKRVLYVPGNHEFYGSTIDATLRELAERSAGTNVTVLDDAVAIVDGVRFLGSTLWTDFRLDGVGEARAAAMDASRRLVHDYSRIRAGDGSPFTPELSAGRFARHAAWLDAKLGEPFAGPTVVITHHAPARRSVHPRFADSPINPCFVSDAAHLMGAARVRLWIHGHTHDGFDYEVAGTRVLCNPRGYLFDGENENRSFDPALTVDVG
jgi:predicted phosphodiesterase